MKKNEYMAMIIKDYLRSLGKGTHTLTALEARKLPGMDDYAANSCYPNVCIAMDKVAKEYYVGTALNDHNQSSTYAYEYIVK
ncbi:hypothetical protein [Pseudobutyrivibrio ruminis]|uniref:Uncharacterized protein n=1 Tax=Pseudobutyrivibrio ruminis DSM 9787 TaxID=1123011 RepID=A0A285T5D9_9FIRM|nr:hypothetical protein [Pseudobutyrivibrio ruminis]SOC16426.1 hypothetical protein SAMN02910411_0398 [Pseudobutyrivibrio ruminis DSM 9787]